MRENQKKELVMGTQTPVEELIFCLKNFVDTGIDGSTEKLLTKYVDRYEYTEGKELKATVYLKVGEDEEGIEEISIQYNKWAWEFKVKSKGSKRADTLYRTNSVQKLNDQNLSGLTSHIEVAMSRLHKEYNIKYTNMRVVHIKSNGQAVIEYKFGDKKDYYVIATSYKDIGRKHKELQMRSDRNKELIEQKRKKKAIKGK